MLVTSAIVVFAALGFTLWLSYNGLNAARKFIPWQFSEVAHTNPQELNAWLKDPNRTAPLLWDVRRKDEFNVSRLPNALNISPETSDSELKKILKNPNQCIVVYCAVGYRSAIMAERLKSLNHTNVFNLEGAIFAWATEGYPLEGSNKVHPFNSMGSLMLRDDLEAD